MKKIIYLDAAATTPVYPRVVKAMVPYFTKQYGNPGSPHLLGEQARIALDEARKKLAEVIGAKPWEVVFTSGATESNTFAFYGIVLLYPKKKKIIISAFEHASVYETCMSLKNCGYAIVEIPVNKGGLLDMQKLEKEIDSATLLVSVIHGHNELGVVQDIRKIGELCRAKGVLFHTDAVQSYARETIDVKAMNIDLLSASAHKIGGPKGIGLLYVRDGIQIHSIMHGGGQELGRRAGTENTAGAVGFAAAAAIIQKRDKRRILNLRDYFMKELESLGGKINGSREHRLENNVHVSFIGIDAEMLVAKLSQQGIMCSTRSACSETEKKDNRILHAIRLSSQKIQGAVRFSFAPYTTKKDINTVILTCQELLFS